MTRSPLAHGQLCYLQIPADDVARSGAFYAAVFGWTVDGASFEAPGIIGQFSADRPPAVDAATGLLGWISVDRMDEALEHVRAHAGEPLEEPYADGPNRMLATVRDPAGNVIGVVEHHGAG